MFNQECNFMLEKIAAKWNKVDIPGMAARAREQYNAFSRGPGTATEKVNRMRSEAPNLSRHVAALDEMNRTGFQGPQVNPLRNQTRGVHPEAEANTPGLTQYLNQRDLRQGRRETRNGMGAADMKRSTRYPSAVEHNNRIRAAGDTLSRTGIHAGDTQEARNLRRAQPPQLDPKYLERS